MEHGHLETCLVRRALLTSYCTFNHPVVMHSDPICCFRNCQKTRHNEAQSYVHMVQGAQAIHVHLTKETSMESMNVALLVSFME